jgi:hypothetical protein
MLGRFSEGSDGIVGDGDGEGALAARPLEDLDDVGRLARLADADYERAPRGRWPGIAERRGVARAATRELWMPRRYWP